MESEVMYGEKADVPEEEYLIPIGKANVVREGTDITIVSFNKMMKVALGAAEELAKEGISAEVIDLRTLLPLDKASILKSVQKTSKALIVYEDNKTLGYGAEVAALIVDEGFEYLDAPVKRLAGADVPAVPFSHPMQEFFMPNPDKIADAIRDLAAY